jgi:hypothetical protein
LEAYRINLAHLFDPMMAVHMVIPPFLALVISRGQATKANFCLGVMPPRAIFGRS